MLELNIDRLSQGMESVQDQCYHSHSHSHHQDRSHDRHDRSLSWHRLERHVTFCNPEVEVFSGESPYREFQGHSTRVQPERGNVGPLPTQRLELVHL